MHDCVDVDGRSGLLLSVDDEHTETSNSGDLLTAEEALESLRRQCSVLCRSKAPVVVPCTMVGTPNSLAVVVAAGHRG